MALRPRFHAYVVSVYTGGVIPSKLEKTTIKPFCILAYTEWYRISMQEDTD